MSVQCVRKDACDTWRYHLITREPMPTWLRAVAEFRYLEDLVMVTYFEGNSIIQRIPYGYYFVEGKGGLEILSEIEFNEMYVDSRDMILLQVTREEIENVLKDKNMSGDATVEEARDILARVADVSLFHRDTVEYYIDEVISERLKDPQST